MKLSHSGSAQAASQTPRDIRSATSLRCATRDRALAVISHELRQPLNVIQMNASLLQRLPAPAAPLQLQGIAQAMQRAIESQARLIDDLLDFSRVRTGKLALRCAARKSTSARSRSILLPHWVRAGLRGASARRCRGPIR